ncbi:MAG: hypothetical protein Q9186_003978 [Xanthomendoza sp. 1 TL-2023]
MSPEAGVFQSARGQWKYDEDWFDKVHDWTSPTTEDESNHTPTQYQDFFIVHDHCVNIVQKFIEYQDKSTSPHSPKSVKELIDIWCTRQKESSELRMAYAARGEIGKLPSDWASFPNLEHSHLYFGARRFWSDPWDCVPGYEYLCTDPTQESETETFLSTWLTRPQMYSNSLFSSSMEQPKSSEDSSLSHKEFVHFPREIHDLITSHISLKDAVNFCSSCRKLSKYCDSTFWRSQTMRLHRCWLWELRDPIAPILDGSWKELLQLLTTNRFQIQREAKPYWHITATKDVETENRVPEIAEPSKMPLPLGLQNRQRIWMCLESLGTKADWEVKEAQHKKPRGHRK